MNKAWSTQHLPRSAPAMQICPVSVSVTAKILCLGMVVFTHPCPSQILAAPGGYSLSDILGKVRLSPHIVTDLYSTNNCRSISYWR